MLLICYAVFSSAVVFLLLLCDHERKLLILHVTATLQRLSLCYMGVCTSAQHEYKSSHYSMSSMMMTSCRWFEWYLGDIILTPLFVLYLLWHYSFHLSTRSTRNQICFFVCNYIPVITLRHCVACLMRVYQEALPITNWLIGGLWSQHCYKKFTLRRSFNEWSVGSVINRLITTSRILTLGLPNLF